MLACLLFLDYSAALLYNPRPSHLPRGNTAHRWLGLPTSFISQENVFTGQSAGGNSLVDVSSRLPGYQFASG